MSRYRGEKIVKNPERRYGAVARFTQTGGIFGKSPEVSGGIAKAELERRKRAVAGLKSQRDRAIALRQVPVSAVRPKYRIVLDDTELWSGSAAPPILAGDGEELLI